MPLCPQHCTGDKSEDGYRRHSVEADRPRGVDEVSWPTLERSCRRRSDNFRGKPGEKYSRPSARIACRPPT